MEDQRFLIDGVQCSRAWLESEESFAAGQGALARAHAINGRVLCLCRDPGVEMYVAKRQRYFVARMPESGPKHASECPSYALATEMSGLAEYESALAEQLQAEHPSFAVSFPLLHYDRTRVVQPAASPAPRERVGPPARSGAVSLNGVLQVLWAGARLNVWHPKMAGKRNYGLIHHVLATAAADMSILDRGSLAERLYMPERFVETQREQLAQRRADRLGHLCRIDGAAHHLAIVVGLVKTFEETKFGGRVVLRHDLNEAFWLDRPTFEALSLKHTWELAALAIETVRLVLCGLVEKKRSGRLGLVGGALLRVSAECLPLWSEYDAALTGKLVASERSFIKPMRFDAGGEATLKLPNVMLTDAGNEPTPMFVIEPASSRNDGRVRRGACGLNWTWDLAAGRGAMPRLPPAVARAARGAPRT